MIDLGLCICQRKRAETAGLLNRNEGCELFAFLMKFDRFFYVYVAETIPVSQAESFISNIFCDSFYAPESEKGLLWNDTAFGIQWPMEPTIISNKDRNQPAFNLFHENIKKI